jgi:hypothetical protein
MLIRLCQILVVESLKGSQVMTSFAEAEFDAMVAKAKGNTMSPA